MERKVYTFLICPGAHGTLRRVPLPSYVVHLMLALCVVGVVSVATLANSYARMLLKVSGYNGLRTQHEALRRQYRTLEKAVAETSAKLDSLESLAGEVALAYGFSRARRQRFPQTVLAVWARHRHPLGPRYSASLCAFNLLKTNVFSLPGYSAERDGEFLEALQENSALPSIWPVRGEVTAGFGQRMDPFTGEGAFHAGVDIAASAGTTVVAAADGILFHAGPNAGYGNEVLIDHGYGTITKYSHLNTTHVVIGQEVRRGQEIGTVGMTGRATGPHLHYEVLVQEIPVNPAKYLPRDTELLSFAASGTPELAVAAALGEPGRLASRPAPVASARTTASGPGAGAGGMSAAAPVAAVRSQSRLVLAQADLPPTRGLASSLSPGR